MEDRKIVKNRRRVEFTLSDGSTFEGKVFVNLYDVNHEGPQRVGTLLNGKDVFLPVETDTGLVHLNIDTIITARTSLLEEGHELMTLGEPYRVQMTLATAMVLEGRIFVNLPRERSRVSDFLNQGDRFFRIFVDQEVVYVAARFIFSVRD